MKMHHAIVFEGEGEEGLELIYSHAQETLGFSPQGNPDFEIIEEDRFTIEHARSLKEQAIQAPLYERRVFVLISSSFLTEAQNALLKLLEEPPKNVHFYILIPSLHTLLPTVRSRLSYGGNVAEKDAYETLVTEYLQANTQQRLTLVEPFITNKERNQARKFLQSLERRLHDEGIEKNKILLNEIYYIRQYLTDRSSSVKMLLEHLVACT